MAVYGAIFFTSHPMDIRAITIKNMIDDPRGRNYTGKDIVEKMLPEYGYLFEQMNSALKWYEAQMQTLLDEAKIIHDSKNQELKQESIFTSVGQKKMTIEQLYNNRFVQHWKTHLKEAQKIRELMRTERYKQDITMHIDRYLQFLRRSAFNGDVQAELPSALDGLETVWVTSLSDPVGSLGTLRYRVRQKYPELFGPLPRLVPAVSSGIVSKMVFDTK